MGKPTQLELKHLLAYLEHDLKVMFFDELYKLQIRETNRGGFIGISLANANLRSIKPVLRPLNDLYISIDGIESPMIAEIGIKWKRKSLADVSHYIEHGNLMYNKMQMLLSRHFDVFGLIEAGLAVDINTLQPC